MLRSWRVLYILTSKYAFRHSGVQFLMSPLSTYLRTRRFNRPTFGLTRHTNLWENTAFRDFSNIWRVRIFFLLTFWLLHLLSTDLIILLLLFNSPYCRKFLFKLPLINYTNMGVSKNNGTPKSSIFIGFYIINHPFWGTPRFGNTHIVQESNRWMPCHLQWGSSCRCEGALGPGFAGKNLWSSNVVLIKVSVTTSTDQKILGSKFPSQGYFNYCTLLCFLLFFCCTIYLYRFFEC